MCPFQTYVVAIVYVKTLLFYKSSYLGSDLQKQYRLRTDKKSLDD